MTEAPTVAPGLRVGRGLELVPSGERRCCRPLRPAYGSGEDWNHAVVVGVVLLPELRPAYGSGEDWNRSPSFAVITAMLLRPAYGSGEDWNQRGLRIVLCGHAVAPGLELVEHEQGVVEVELRPAYGSGEDWNGEGLTPVQGVSGCARPTGRARIGT